MTSNLNPNPSPPAAASTPSTTAGLMDCPAPGHSFLSGLSEVKNMENSLLTLLSSFHAGELGAFGQGRSLETMEAIRAKQERLARLHFELGAVKTTTAGSQPPTMESSWMSDSDQNKLLTELTELSVQIEKLHETGGGG